MRMVSFKSVSFFILCFCLSCTNTYYTMGDTLTLVHPVSEKVYNLDEVTVRLTNQIQYFKYLDIDVLALYSPFDNSIRLFNYQTKEEILKIPLGDISRGKGIQGFTFAEGVVYLYNYTDHVVIKADLNESLPPSETNLSKNLIQRKDFFPPIPYIGTCAPLIVYGQYIILSGFVAGEDRGENPHNRPSIVVIDESNGNVNNAVNYPDLYASGNWGGGFCYRRPYCTMGPNGNVIISFPAFDSLVEFNIITRDVRSYPAKTSQISYIKPFSRRKGVLPSSTAEIEWYMKTPSYENIVYNPYRMVYYRFFRLPDVDYSISSYGNHKPIGIIILDEKMEAVREVILPDNNYNLNNCLVTEDGLLIQKITDSEDELAFDIFQLS